MKLYVSKIPLHIALGGADAVFEPNVPRPLRDSLVPTALDMGATVAGEEAATSQKPTVSESETVNEGDIVEVIELLLSTNETTAFGADGKPKVRSIEKLLGAQITADERDRAWKAIKHDG